MNSNAATMPYMKVSIKAMERSGLGCASCCGAGVWVVLVGLGVAGFVEVPGSGTGNAGAGPGFASSAEGIDGA